MSSLVSIPLRIVALATAVVLASGVRVVRLIPETGGEHRVRTGEPARTLALQSAKVEVGGIPAQAPRGLPGSLPISWHRMALKALRPEPLLAPPEARQTITHWVLRRIPSMDTDEPPRAGPSPRSAAT